MTLLEDLDVAAHVLGALGGNDLLAARLRAAAVRLHEEIVKHGECPNGFSLCSVCAALTRINGSAK